VADDQPHILEAVELLLAPHGIEVDCVRSPRLLMEALGERDYDVLLIDLNYTRDTTSGSGRPGSAGADPGVRLAACR
jgi:DNA-binding response OmpR family regulator